MIEMMLKLNIAAEMRDSGMTKIGHIWVSYRATFEASGGSKSLQ
jgi:hypothetical protein